MKPRPPRDSFARAARAGLAIARLPTARGLAFASALLLTGCAQVPGANLPDYPQPDAAQPHARVLLRGSVGATDRVAVVVLQDNAQCKEPALLARGQPPTPSTSARLRTDRLVTLDLMVLRTGLPSCISRWTFQPQAGKTYLARVAAAPAGCMGQLLDTSVPDLPLPPPDLLQRNAPTSMCQPLAQSTRVRNPLDGGQVQGEAVLHPHATTKDLEGLIRR